MVENYISYSNILENIKNFRYYSKEIANAGTKEKKWNYVYSDIDAFDEPGTFFFKVMFYFNNPGSDNEFTSNLLGLTDSSGQIEYDSKNNAELEYSHNTAFNFLMMNAEYERANYLKEFIYLLSDISSSTPWYFQSIEGLDTAQERAYLKDFKFDGESKSITIKCLEDSIDTRISTLLSLYRSACFSHVWKKEIVPANLRKFDMGVYIFQTPIKGRYGNNSKKLPTSTDFLNINNDLNFTNCKYYEFHDCEINLESLKSIAGNTPSNAGGFAIEPSIIINYNECYIHEYNDQLCLAIGDLVKQDLELSVKANESDISKASESSSNIKTNILTGSDVQATQEAKMTEEDTNNTIGKKVKAGLSTLTGQLTGKAITKVKSIITKAYLGNVYGLSVRNLVGRAEQFLSGDMTGAIIGTTKDITRNVKNVTESAASISSVPKKTNLGNVNTNTILRNL